MEQDLAIPIPGDRPLVAFCVQHLHRMGEPYMCNVRICIYFCWARIAFCDPAHHLRSHFFLSCFYFFPVSHEQTMISSRNVWHSGDSRTHKIHTHAAAVCHYLPKVIVFVPYFSNVSICSRENFVWLRLMPSIQYIYRVPKMSPSCRRSHHACVFVRIEAPSVEQSLQCCSPTIAARWCYSLCV